MLLEQNGIRVWYMKKYLCAFGKILLLPVAVYGIFLLLIFDRFSKGSCLYTIFLQSIIPTITAYGLAVGYICGIFDFTIGARIVISGLVGGLMAMQFGMPGLLVGAFVSSVLVSVVTGALNWVCRIPSLIITLGLTMILEIVGKSMAGRFSFIQLDTRYALLGSAPYIIFVLLLCMALYYVIDSRTAFSYEMRAVGSNEAIAQSAGIRTQMVKFLTFVIGSVFLAVSAVLTLSQSGSMGAQIDLGSVALVFKPMMSIIIALTIKRYCPMCLGIFIGQFTLNTIFVGLIAAGLPDTFQNVALGFFLLVVIIISNNKERFRRAGRRAQKAAV
jgi:ribose transport system permease protein